MTQLRTWFRAFLFVVSLLTAFGAHAASLQTVSGFSNPGNLTMQKYIPDGMPASGAPIVVVLHGCTQSGPEYYANAGWQQMADTYKFALLVPSQQSSNNFNLCFNWFQSSDFGRGNGEAASIYNALQQVISDNSLDSNRVFVTGVSAGGAMTMDMAGSYPDVFKGAAVMAGVYYMCASDSISGINCTSNAGSLTASQLGDLVRNANSGYNGPWPKVQIFHGTSDTAVTPNQMTQEMKQWTNVNGIDQTSDETFTIGGGSGSTGVTTVNRYKDSNGKTLVETYSIAAMPHGVAVDPGTGTGQCGTTGTYYIDENFCSSYIAASFWGITGSAPGGPAAPTNLQSTGSTNTSISLSWTASTGPNLAGYNVYRNSTKVNGSLVTGTTYTDSGLTASTTYSYYVTAVDTNSVESQGSNTIQAATTGGGGTTTKTFNSIASDDGYVKATSAGGSAQVGIYSTPAIGKGGDGLYSRTVLSFDTSAIPDTATITRAYVTVTYSSSFGNPWNDPSGNTLTIDVKNGCFGAACTMGTDDWSASGTATGVATIAQFSSGTKQSGDFNSSGLSAINKTGKTQLKLRFSSFQTSLNYIFIQEGTGAVLTVEYQ